MGYIKMLDIYKENPDPEVSIPDSPVYDTEEVFAIPSG